MNGPSLSLSPSASRPDSALKRLQAYNWEVEALAGTEITFERSRICGQVGAFPRILNNKSRTVD